MSYLLVRECIYDFKAVSTEPTSVRSRFGVRLIE